MGTNYYLEEASPCPCCGRPFDRKHIGKSSAGWCFALHVDPENGINDLSDWERLWSAAGASIVNEYGDAVTVEEMRRTICERGPWREDAWSPDELSLNHATKGPKGLVRHSLDPRHCIGHGEGTWDLCPGEFS